MDLVWIYLNITPSQLHGWTMVDHGGPWWTMGCIAMGNMGGWDLGVRQIGRGPHAIDGLDLPDLLPSFYLPRSR